MFSNLEVSTQYLLQEIFFICITNIYFYNDSVFMVHY